MSVRYELARLLLRVTVAVGIAVALAAVWAALHGGTFRHSLGVGLYVVGAFAFVAAAAGGLPSRRDAAGARWMERMAYRDTFAANRDNPPDQTLGPLVVFGAVGCVLIALAWLIS